MEYIVTVRISAPLADMNNVDRAYMVEEIAKGVEWAGCEVLEITAEEVSE